MKKNIKRALISVSDKEHLLSLAELLTRFQVEIISSGGTYQYLTDHKIKVKKLEDFTKTPEVFGGRVKTLGVPVLGSLLYRRDNEKDLTEASKLDLNDIDLVVCNFYPFKESAKKYLIKSNLNEEININELYEKIDIGGPTMVRAAAKNFPFVTVLSSPKDYLMFMKEFEELEGGTTIELRQKLSLKAYKNTFFYEKDIASILSYLLPENLSDSKLRYGENPHQKSFLLSQGSTFKQLQGKELSYNNYLDLDAAVSILKDINHLNLTHFSSAFPSATIIVKHLNPCGVALSNNPKDSLNLAISGDPVSSFGGIFAFNFTIEKDLAVILCERFIEIIIAPRFTEEAKKIFEKKKNLRLLEIPEDFLTLFSENKVELNFKHLSTNEFLIQEEDFHPDNILESVTKTPFPPRLKELAQFGIKLCKWGKSNAIALVEKSPQGMFLIGTGFGQQNRIDSMEKLAIPRMKEKEKSDLNNIVLISDAFFPFPDSIEVAHRHGISYVVSPGGSIKDEEIIETANKLNISMVFTSTRHFKH